MVLSSFDILKYFAKQKDYKRIEISNFQQQAELQSNLMGEIYFFDLTYQDGDRSVHRKLVLRLSRIPGVSYEREVAIINRLRKFKYPIPRIFEAEDNSDYFGGSYMMMERIPGDPLGDVIDTYITEQYVDKQFVHQCHELIQLLQIMDFSDNTQLFPEKKTAETTLQDMQESLDSFLTDIPAPYHDPLTKLHSWISGHLEELDPLDPVLVHGDFHTYNIMHTPDKEMFVLDWTNCRYDDPRTDFAWFTVANLTMLQYTKAVRLHEHLVEISDFDRHDVDVLTLFWSLQKINLFWSALRDEEKMQGMSQDKIFTDYDWSNLENYIFEITGIEIPSIWELLDTCR